MTIEDIIAHFPVLYHMSEAGSWESIRRHGLLSTSALLDLFEYSGAQRGAIEAHRRPKSIQISHPVHGTATIRDQAPISDAALERWLIDMSPTDWYRLLNARVFFWLGRRRLETLLGARLYRGQAHDVLTVDTAALVENHVHRISLARINTGATHRGGSPRGSNTFSSVKSFPFRAVRRSAASVAESIAELAVDHSVSDIEELVIRVERVRDRTVIETIHAP